MQKKFDPHVKYVSINSLVNIKSCFLKFPYNIECHLVNMSLPKNKNILTVLERQNIYAEKYDNQKVENQA